MNSRQLWSIAALLGAIVFGPVQSAHAVAVPLPGAYTAIGRFSGSNQNYLVSLNQSTGACQRAALGGNVGGGGPSANMTVTGSSSSDVIFFITTSNAIHCGTWGNMRSFLSNGFKVTINAGSGDDWIEATTVSNLDLGGDAGNDFINSASNAGNIRIWGWTGNDILVGGAGAEIFGEGDNDTMCAVYPQTIETFSGGSGADTYCGMSTNPPSSATQSCANCP